MNTFGSKRTAPRCGLPSSHASIHWVPRECPTPGSAGKASSTKTASPTNPTFESAKSKRRWALDPIPLILPESEWELLSRAVIQRATLWNRILQNCYGPQTLLLSGLLPPSLLFAQPNFNRALCNLPTSGRPLLTLYAVDVARTPDGGWTVLADRTEAPDGTGFALENRIVLTSVFPGTSKRVNLIRLAPFFQALRGALYTHAPSGVDSPRVVLLSPGPGNRTYFEDAYLSRYFGITLALGEELTVRDDRLYLKTVSGLQRVHVLLRRVPENEADPLETPTKSHLGVPGLMHVARSGGVALINPPGTGIAEAPAFLPFLPPLPGRGPAHSLGRYPLGRTHTRPRSSGPFQRLRRQERLPPQPFPPLHHPFSRRRATGKLARADRSRSPSPRRAVRDSLFHGSRLEW